MSGIDETSLLFSLIALAISLSVVLRPKRTSAHWSFFGFGGSVAAFYLSSSLASSDPRWARINLICAVSVPLLAAAFFRWFTRSEARSVATLFRWSLVGALTLVAVTLTPHYGHTLVRAAIFTYLVAVLGLSLSLLWARARKAPSHFDSGRLRFLGVMGALSAIFTLTDYLPLVGLEIPRAGSVLTLVFLFILSQAIVRSRLLDLYELAGRLGVLTALSFMLAGVFSILMLVGGRVFLHSMAAALIVLLIYDPVRLRMESWISQFFFRERYDLERTIGALRRRLAHVLELEHIADIVLPELERSRRVTHAALYFVDADMRGYALAGHLGPAPIRRIEIAAARPLLDVLSRVGEVLYEQVERDLLAQATASADREAETSHEVSESMRAMNASVCVAIHSEREIHGLLCLHDERLRDAFSPEEVQLFAGLASQIETAFQNSRLHQRMKERDRLAMMGEMAAGLAHEIRNPLGAIKASAQYLVESPESDTEGSREFLDIIVEEADRLNRVVSSFLDYANPAHEEEAMSIDVNAVVTRTAQVLATTTESVDLMRTLSLARELPRARIDPERLRQVLINLIQNALEAVQDGGNVRVETEAKQAPDAEGTSRTWVEIRVIDTGPGIPQQVLKRLFEPFVTTRQRGTGLGLAISHRIVRAARGRIFVRSEPDQGSVFTVRLPAAVESKAAPSLVPRAREVESARTSNR